MKKLGKCEKIQPYICVCVCVCVCKGVVTDKLVILMGFCLGLVSLLLFEFRVSTTVTVALRV